MDTSLDRQQGPAALRGDDVGSGRFRQFEQWTDSGRAEAGPATAAELGWASDSNLRAPCTRPVARMTALLETKRLAWAVTFALVTVMALLAYFAGKRYLAAVRAVEHTMAVQTAIHGTLTLLVDAETGHRGYLLTGDERFLEPLYSAERGLPSDIGDLQKLTAGDAEQGLQLTAIQRLAAQKLSFIHSTDDLRRAGRFEEALTLVSSLRGKELMDQVRVRCQEMLDHEQQLLVQRKSEAQQAERLAVMGVGIGTLLMVALAFISLLTVSRDVEELKRTADELSKSEEHYRLLTDQSSDLVRLLSLTGNVSYVSPSVERILGYSVAEYLTQPKLSLMHPSELEAATEHLVRSEERQTLRRRFDLPAAPQKRRVSLVRGALGGAALDLWRTARVAHGRA